ncbi:hypothetical protein pb186bvf_013372 [Paramecium bursaria]
MLKQSVLQDCNQDRRVETLESNMNRVCIQQDALMPLLQMIEYIPSIQRTEQTVKNVLKKQESNETKSARLERCVERKMKELDLYKPKPQIQIEDVNQKVNELDQSLNCLYRWYETKLKEESQQIVRNLDEKLHVDPNSDFHEELLRVVNLTMKSTCQAMLEDFTLQIQEIKQLL